MGKKIEKTRNGNTWTEAQYFSAIRSALRLKFRYYKPMQEALNKASRPYTGTNKRIKKEYKCCYCSKWVMRKDCEINHKIACGSLNNYDDIVPFIKRLTCEDVSCYEIACKSCHLEITNEERRNKKNTK